MASPILAPTFKPSPVIAIIPGIGVEAKSPGQAGSAFKAILADSIQQVQHSADFASKSVEQFLSGENSDLHQVAIASQKAELTFEFFLQARNKVVQAYQEVMRMQV